MCDKATSDDEMSRGFGASDLLVGLHTLLMIRSTDYLPEHISTSCSFLMQPFESELRRCAFQRLPLDLFVTSWFPQIYIE
jgi:hypothetical protein